MRRCRLVAILVLGLLLPPALQGGDWPQWRGPQRDGHSTDTGLLKEWPKDGPPLAWTFTSAGTGYGQPVAVGERIYVLGARDNTEMVIALSTEGKELWKSPIGPMWDFKTNAWSGGPNSAPTVDGDALYALGSQGDLVCVALADGAVRWKKSLTKEMSAQVNPVGGGPEVYGWGFSWSPLVDGDRLIITPGGEKGLVAALDKKSGKVLWQTEKLTDQCTYASPIAEEVHGVRQYLVMTQDGIVGVGTDGKVLWEHRKGRNYPDIVADTPVYHDGKVLITATRGGAELVEIKKEGDGFKAASVYVQRRMSNGHGGLVRVGKHVYGAYELRSWKCFDFATGDIAWESERSDPGAGSLSYADGCLYTLSQDTNVVALLEASPEACKLKSSFTLPQESKERKSSGKLWTHPVIANGHLYVRDQNLLFCYKVKK